MDRVLIDAPCSATGIHRRQPDALFRLEERGLGPLIALQRRLLSRAIDLVRPGGRILYATCSVLREENEAVVEATLAADPRLRPVPLSETLGEELAARLGASHAARIGPGPGAKGPDGFFLALLQRAT
jgi:16S rRNA (cytosine967-C5)-methyltransferase